MKRNAIALLITLALVGVITALIAVSSAILEHAYKRIHNKQLLVQSNVMFNHFMELFKSNSADVSDPFTLELFLMVPLSFQSEATGLKLEATFESAATAPNINHLIKDINQTNAEPQVAYADYLDRILAIYDVSDRILLAALIEDTLDTDHEERVPGSEIALSDPFFIEGKIHDINHLLQVIEVYKLQTKDTQVDNIAWKKLFVFDGDKVDVNYITPESLMAVNPEFDEMQTLELTTQKTDTYESLEAFALDSEMAERFKELNIDVYAPLVRGTLTLTDGDKHIGITFLYNFETKEVSSIEFDSTKI